MEADVAEIVRTVALVCSALVSLASALIALLAVRSQRNVAKHTANISRLSQAANLIPSTPKLLEFHGVSLDELEKRTLFCGVLSPRLSTGGRIGSVGSLFT